MHIAPGQGAYSPQGHPFDVNRNFLSLRSSIASFKSETPIVSEKSIVLPFSHTKAKGTKFDLAVKQVKSTQGHHLNNLLVFEHLMRHTKF